MKLIIKFKCKLFFKNIFLEFNMNDIISAYYYISKNLLFITFIRLNLYIICIE